MNAPRRYGDAPILVDRTVARDALEPGGPQSPRDPRFWGDAWVWRCTHVDCQPQTPPWEPLPGTEGRIAGSGHDSWAEAVRLGLTHLTEKHLTDPEARP